MAKLVTTHRYYRWNYRKVLERSESFFKPKVARTVGSYQEQLLKLQEEAKHKKLGMWAL